MSISGYMDMSTDLRVYGQRNPTAVALTCVPNKLLHKLAGNGNSPFVGNVPHAGLTHETAQTTSRIQ